MSESILEELNKAKSDLSLAEKTQTLMKDVNAIIRSNKDMIPRITALGISESTANKLLEKDFAGRIGFPTYKLTNNNANIKRLKDRVNMLEKKWDGAKADKQEIYEFTDGTVEVNYEIDRVQILFNGKPEADVRTILKKNGWNWSPTNGAWQRKITPQAISNAKYITNAKYVESEADFKIGTQADRPFTINDIESRNFTYISANGYGFKEELEAKGMPTNHLVFNTVVNTNSAFDAMRAVEKLFTEQFPNLDVKKLKINTYTKTYVRESKQLFDEGKFIPGGNPSKIFAPMFQVLKQAENAPIKAEKDELPVNIKNAAEIVNAIGPSLSDAGDEERKEYYDAMKEIRSAGYDMELGKVFKKETETVIEPNTSEEFDEAIISGLEPHDGWIGNEIKERAIKKQISDKIIGGHKEHRAELVERIFNKFKEIESKPKQAIKAQEPSPIIKLNEPESDFKGIDYTYKNQYVLNKAIEAFLTHKGDAHENYTSSDKNFIRKYSGYGGLDQFGKTGKGGLFEYYTPKTIIGKMWALAYKYGYNNGPVLEPSVATGEFLQYAKPNVRVVGYEISEWSAKICRILYPTAEIILQPFEQTFIKNNFTIKDKTEELEKFDLVVGNPPYGDFSIVESRYMSGMGEKDHVKPRNYVEYFIRRGVDLLNKDGLLIYIVGSQVKAGGIMFLDSGPSVVKEYLNEYCELLEAYRLPNSVFERTGVTSDIIVLKKIK